MHWIFPTHFCGYVLCPKLREVGRAENPQKTYPVSMNLSIPPRNTAQKKILIKSQWKTQSDHSHHESKMDQLRNNKDKSCGDPGGILSLPSDGERGLCTVYLGALAL